jgi:DNA processing protein
MATVVIEAGETSGALITATFAAEQGREVFAVPGSILAPQSKGTNRLIREGARPMLNVEEVLEVSNLEQVQEYRQARLALPADEVETKLLEVLQDEPLHVDEIQYRSGLPVDKVSATLVMMELKGMVRQAGAMTYQAVREPSTLYRTNK